MTEINVPLLIIAFNRPDVFRILMDTLSHHKFRRLYIFVDHERENVPGEAERVEECREIARSVDFCDEKLLNFSSCNLGCGYGPFSAITWAFQSTEELVILEDDCIPGRTFFSFCEEMLAKYRADNQIWMISGNNFSEKSCHIADSYTFSGYAHFWGWATWKRSWAEVVYDRQVCHELVGRIPENRFLNKKEKGFFISEYRTNFLRESDDLWDYQAALSMALKQGLSIVPRSNLVTNIGRMGTHFSSDRPFFNQKADDYFFVEKHPEKIERDIAYDLAHFNNHWLTINRRPVVEKLKNRIKKLIKTLGRNF